MVELDRSQTAIQYGACICWIIKTRDTNTHSECAILTDFLRKNVYAKAPNYTHIAYLILYNEEATFFL
jgi:hypothetical protein